MADLEDALKKLDRLTQEEARMAHTEVLRVAHSIREEVKIVDGKVERVDDKVGGVGDRVDDVGDKVEEIGDQVRCVDDKVQVVIDGTRGLLASGRFSNPSNIYYACQTANKRE
jgi:archaellum component FlaC